MTKRGKSTLPPAWELPDHRPYRFDPAPLRQDCLETLDKLVSLYCKTDPRLGRVSEKNKQRAAIDAVRLAGHLTRRLSYWAESHLLGAFYRHSQKEPKAEFDWDSHANEHEWLKHADLANFSPGAVPYRKFIATVLEKSSGNRRDWRSSLSTGLLALNEGATQFLTKPSKTSKHGRPYTLAQLQWFAVLHVHALFGSGLKKYAAEHKVAAALATSVETLRAWEKKSVKSYDNAKATLLLAQKLGRHQFHDFENEFPHDALPAVRSFEEAADSGIEWGKLKEHAFRALADCIVEWGDAVKLHVELQKHPLRILARELTAAKARL